MKRLLLFFALILLGIIGFAQNTSPLVVKDFVLQTNGIMDIDQVPRDARTDWDNNPVCQIQVKAVGFDENLMQKFTFIANGLEIMHTTMKNGMFILYVSSNKMGEIVIKHMGDCTFKLPYKLEGHKIYVMTLGMETATLVIRTIPTNAEIFVDNQKVGTGEAISAVSIGGEHRYRVVCEDYYTKEGVVVFSKREEKSINVELEPNYGFITIKTEPSGADVYVDNVKVGVTPYMMKKITLGNHVVELRKNGYEIVADMVAVNKGEVNKQLENVALIAKRVVYGTLFVTSTPEGADINVDGDYMGRTPQTFNIVAGEHKIVLNKQGCTETSKTVIVNENQTTNVNLYLESGREITITTNGTGDKIYVDGIYVGESPLTKLLGYGSHEIKASNIINVAQKFFTVERSGGATEVHIEISNNMNVIVNDVEFEMIPVKGGTIMLDEKQETVDDFYIGKFEVTNGLWNAVMGTNDFIYEYDHPRSNITWADCQLFVKKLNQLTNKNFRLPTKAEWCFASNGGNRGRGYKYSGSDDSNEVGWVSGNSNNETHPVGTKAPNELGIYDMTGNVSEWCQDYNKDGKDVGRVKLGLSYHKDTYNIGISKFETLYCGLRIAYSPNYANSSKGKMEISSNPEGAAITIDGKDFGVTPFVFENAPGKYTVTISMDGYEDATQTIELKAGWIETTIIDITRIKQQIVSDIKCAFSVSDDVKVCFAKGNLQYQASTKTYRFAEHPWEVIGKGNEKKSPTYKNWIDLFGWGSGDNPTMMWKDQPKSTFVDWGKNDISNGEGKKWFTLEHEQWYYVFVSRRTTCGVNYVLATVNKVKGVILLPDNWDMSIYSLRTDAAYSSNMISQAVWENTLEPNGAVFLPATAGEFNFKLDSVGVAHGAYWSATEDDDIRAYQVSFHEKDKDYPIIYTEDGVSSGTSAGKTNGFSVRLVRLAE
jgi:hypothetical protein